MAPGNFLGEFEHALLLTILQLENTAHAIRIREHLATHAERSVSRGALYATLERLVRKGFLTWSVDEAVPGRGGLARRRFEVTPPGLEAVRTSQRIINRLSDGLEEALRS